MQVLPDGTIITAGERGTILRFGKTDNPSEPRHFHLDAVYPNPASPSTTIRFHLFDSRRATLMIYNLLGRRMATILDDVLPAGWPSLEYPTAGLATGVYIVVLKVGTEMDSIKLLVFGT